MTKIRRVLTAAEKSDVISWASEQMVPWGEVWDYVFSARQLEGYGLMGRTLPADFIRPIAESASLEVGGSYGGLSCRETPTFKDIDFFFELSSDYTDMNTTQVDHLRKIFLRHRMSRELHKMTKDGGVVPAISDSPIRIQFMVGIRRDGVLWNTSSVCKGCYSRIYGLKQVLQNHALYHPNCLP